jgi:dTDP-4-dehydrorhamnose reductase
LRVLVTGAEGQIARSLLELAANSSDEVVAIGRPDLDLAQSATVERAIACVAPTVVVSAGAYTAVDKAEDEAEGALVCAVNVDGPRIVAATCARLGIPVVHISTDYVFDGCKAAPYLEDDATGPLNAYGRSKLEGERNIAANCEAHIILRTSWVYSPFGHNFLKTMLRLAETKPDIGVVSDQIGNPTYAPHLADAILKIASRVASDPEPSRLAGIYNAASRGDTTWFGFAEEIFRCSRALRGPVARVRPITTADYKTPAKRPASSRLDCTKLEQVLGIVLPSWVDGTHDCVARLVRPAAGAVEGSEDERHHSRGRQGYASLPDDAGHVQATAPSLRQADDLLSADDAHVGENP